MNEVMSADRSFWGHPKTASADEAYAASEISKLKEVSCTNVSLGTAGSAEKFHSEAS